MSIYNSPDASPVSSITSPAQPITTRVGVADEHVAADRSAIHLVTDLLADRIRAAVHRTLECEVEFAVSTAFPDDPARTRESYPSHHGFLAGPTAGESASVTTGLPAAIDPHKPPSVEKEDVLPVPATETPCDYRDLVKLHTHPPRGKGRVGLSHHDLVDNVPGNDEHTQESPFDIYRATGAIVFSPNVSRRLPEPIAKAIDSAELTEESIDTPYIFDERPQHSPGRVWLHLAERSPSAVAMSSAELSKLHHQTLDAPCPENYSLANIRRVLGGTIVESFIPLSP